MRTQITAIRRAVDGMPWAIVPGKLHAMLELFELRAAGNGPRPGFAATPPQKPRLAAGGKIAVLPLHGVVCQRMNMVSDMSGGTSTELFGKQFDAAVADPAVSAIVIDVDSPGGSVNGVPELAAKMFGARGQKRTIAVCNTLNASAAYWISSACDEVVASPSADVGSIGVFSLHEDMSQAAHDAGIKYTVIKAGKYKAEDLPFEPLSTEAKDAMQERVDELYDSFVGSVAKHRGASEQAVRSGYGQGRVLSAKQALKAGLIDRVATLDDVIKSLAGSAPRDIARMAATAGYTQIIEGIAAQASPVLITATADMHDWLVPQADVVQFIPNASAPDKQDDFSPLPANDPARDPTGDPQSTTPAQPDNADSGTGYEADLCPQCGTQMDPNGVCPYDGYVDPDGPSAVGVQPDDDAGASPPVSSDPDDPRIAPGDRVPDGAFHDDAVRAASPAPPNPEPMALKAEETSMPETGAATDPGAATQARFEAYTALAAEHNCSIQDVQRWVAGKLSFEAVSKEIMGKYKTGAQPLVATTSVTGMVDREADRPFANLGEQLVAVVQAGRAGGRFDKRLAAINSQASRFYAGTPSGMSEGVGTDGGFFIAPELLPGVIDPIYKEDAILSRVTRIPIGSNTNGVKYNVVDEISRVNGSRWGGITSAWASEADTAAASKPKLRLFELSLKKLIMFAYLTDELQQDAPAAESLLTRAFAAETQFMLTASIFSGTGAGQPQGFRNSGAMISQAIESTQTIANTASFLGLNTTKMLARIPSSLWGDVIWLYQQELLPYLMNATIGATGTAVPIFMPIAGFTNRPFDTILGRPAFPSEFCEAVGTPGDIYAVVPSQYHVGEKGGAQTAFSTHVRFLNDESVLRITQRIDGAPIWRTTVTPYKGANSRSAFVQLAIRS